MPTEFAITFTPTPRGARPARLFVSHCLDSWFLGPPLRRRRPRNAGPWSPPSCAPTPYCADGCPARTSTSGRPPRRAAAPGGLRPPRRRPPVVAAAVEPDAESGRGHLLVTALVDDWCVADRRCGPGKTVWAVVGTESSRRPGAW